MLSHRNNRLDPPGSAAIATQAVVFEEPGHLRLRELTLPDPGPRQVQVDVEWSGISTGTEKLLWSGAMPPFPGLGYPLVPGYETVGRIVAAGPEAVARVGERVFVSGARCFGEVRGLFGGAASRVVVDADKALPVPDTNSEEAVLLALAATAFHATETSRTQDDPPDLIVGHGALGRLLARIVVARYGREPTVWEIDPIRQSGAAGYSVMHPDADTRTDYRRVIDVSGDSAILDTLIGRLAPHGEIVLAGFYAESLAFAFAPAFMREASILIAAEWQPDDLRAVSDLVNEGRLSLADLVSHRASAADAAGAYPTAFNDPSCLKMVLDWRSNA